jgi:hypothetical protein
MLGCRLDDRVQVQQGLVIFFTTASRPALGPTQPLIQWVPGVLSLGVKQPGHEADHSPPSSAEVKMFGAIPSFPQYTFMAWCSVKAQGQLYFYLYLSLMSLSWYNMTWKKNLSRISTYKVEDIFVKAFFVNSPYLCRG